MITEVSLEHTHKSPSLTEWTSWAGSGNTRLEADMAAKGLAKRV